MHFSQIGYFGLGSTEWAREMVILESAARLGVSDRDSAHWRELAYYGSEPTPAMSTAKPEAAGTEEVGAQPLEKLSQRKSWWWRAVFGNGLAGGFGSANRLSLMR